MTAGDGRTLDEPSRRSDTGLSAWRDGPRPASVVVAASSPRRRLGGVWRRGWFWLIVIIVASVAISAVWDTPTVTTVLALTLGFVIIRTGVFFLQSFATPPPPPPDPGTLRKVKLVYRCNMCGAEVRMTAAAEEDPEPPRHCADDMQLVTPVD